MTDLIKRHWERPPSKLLSVGIFVVMTGIMLYLRLYLFHDRFVTLTYGLPLLICLWHRDRWLLWGMAFAFAAIAFYKAFYVLPDFDPADSWELVQWVFQVTNLLVIGGSIHAILRLLDSLRFKNAELKEANEELQVQAEELVQQNEEIQQQNTEIQQQSEELQEQMAELERQSDELRTSNAELNNREAMLQTLLKTAGLKGEEQSVVEEICKMTLLLVGSEVQCAAVVEKHGDELVVHAQAGLSSLESDRWPLAKSLASIAMEHKRTACVHDLAERPDLIVPQAPGLKMRSSIVTPIPIEGEIVGVMELHSIQPHAWTAREFQLLEWAAKQSGMVMNIHRLRGGLEKLVSERTARLQELVDELEHFSYSITHDLRAPLRAMQGFAGLLVKDGSELPRTHKQYLDHIVQSASRMDRLITDALSYTRAARTDMRLSRVDTRGLIEGIINSYPSLKDPHARVEISGDLPPVLANEAGLTQCFANLLDNAVKFVPAGRQPQVTVRAEREDGQVKIWIEDNGIGITPEFEPYLFQMFRRASREYSGTGIGLALVKKTCERMGGRVGVVSEPGRGSRFWIALQATCKETMSNICETP